jgi:hypothetical protein
MADVLFVAMIVAFFALAGLLVVACDRIIGPPDEHSVRAAVDEVAPEEVPA